MRQKCVRNASEMVKMGLVYWEKRNVPKCVKNASKMRGTPLGENTFWTIPICEDIRKDQRTPQKRFSKMISLQNLESAPLAEPHVAVMFSCRTLTRSAKVSCRTLRIAEPKALNSEKDYLAEPWNAGSSRKCPDNKAMKSGEFLKTLWIALNINSERSSKKVASELLEVNSGKCRGFPEALGKSDSLRVTRQNCLQNSHELMTAKPPPFLGVLLPRPFIAKNPFRKLP